MKRLISRVGLVGIAMAMVALVPYREVAAADAKRFRHLYGLVGFARGQTVRLNVVNTLPPGPTDAEAPPDPCRTRLLLFDGEGGLLAEKRADLIPGRSTSLDLGFVPSDVIAASRMSVRAQVDVFVPPDTPPDPCKSTLEVVDDDTARTNLFVSPAEIHGFNPQPDPPGRE
jgi:hypothetical protein